MAVIKIREIVAGADTAAQGTIVLGQLRKALEDNPTVTVSFEGITTATSSFVNASFVMLLLNDLTLSDIKSRVRVVKSSRQINDMIRTRLEREASAAA